MKKIVSFFLSLVVLISAVPTNIFAQEEVNLSETDRDAIYEILSYVETQKQNYGLADVDFNALTFSNAIKTYEYTKEGIVYLRDFVPLKYNNELVAWAVKDEYDGEVFFQISTVYINEVKAVIDDSTEYAIIYDDIACYLFDGNELFCLGNIESGIGNRAVISSASDLIFDSSITLASTECTEDLDYTTENVDSRGAVRPNVVHSCGIEHVSQLFDEHEYENLCWAACICCIGNYKQVRDYKLEVISEAKNNIKKYRNDSNFDQGLDIVTVSYILIDDYRLPYHLCNYFPTISEIRNSILNDCPIYGAFKYYNSKGEKKGHACVLYDITEIDEYRTNDIIGIMDPQHINTFGSARYISSSRVYKYTAVHNGVTMTLTDAVLYK